MNNRLKIWLLVALVASCKHEVGRYAVPEFREEVTTNVTLISGELPGMNSVNDMWVYGDKIVLVSYVPNTKKCVHIYDKSTGDCLLDVIGQGNGPKEVLNGCRDAVFQDGTLLLYEKSKRQLLRMQVDSLLKHGLDAVQVEDFSCPRWCCFHAPLADSADIVIRSISEMSKDTSSLRRIEVVKGQEVLSGHDWYPVEGAAERFVMGNNAGYALSSSRDHLVIASTLGAILETYSLVPRIKRDTVRYFIEPRFTVKAAGTYDYAEDFHYGFGDVFATDARIFTSFDGSTDMKQYMQARAGDQEMLFSKIAVFDWNGDGVKLFRTDYQIEQLCCDESSGIIYLVARDRDGGLYLGKVQ